MTDIGCYRVAGGRVEVLDARQLRDVVLSDSGFSHLSSDDYREKEADAAFAGQNLLSQGEHGALVDTFEDRPIGVVLAAGGQVVSVRSRSRMHWWSQRLVAGWLRKGETCYTSWASLGSHKITFETLRNPKLDTPDHETSTTSLVVAAFGSQQKKPLPAVLGKILWTVPYRLVSTART